MNSLSPKLPWPLANPKWAAALNPLLAMPLLAGNAVSATLVVSTPMAINHGLGRLPQGWFLPDNPAHADLWRTQPVSQTALTLEASANTTINVWVF